MEVERPKPPEYASHSPETIHLPDAPNHVPTHSREKADVTLPDLKTVLSPQYQESSPPPRSSTIVGSPATSTRSLPRIEPQRRSNGTVSNHDAAVFSPPASGSQQGTEHGVTSRQVSADDADMRDAAEALAVLGSSGKAHQLH